jgi:Terminase large subunit, T4likevirus-type, N-terminal
MELTRPQLAVYNSQRNYNLFMAGIGSGKTQVGGEISYKYISNYPTIRGFIGANSYGQLSKSTLVNFQKVWATKGIRENAHYVIDKQPLKHYKIIGEKLKSYSNTISFSNGCLIYLGSMDSYKMIDGMEFGWAMLDETKDTKEEAVKEVVIGRLRQPGLPEGRNPLYILTSPAKVDWINQWFNLDKHQEEIERKTFSKTDYFRKVTDDQLVVISSTYHNAKNLSKGYIDRLRSAFSGNDELENMLIYGSPFGKSGGEWLHSFDQKNHVKELKYNKDLPLHIALDFNVNPYMTLLVHQVEHKGNKVIVNMIDEICLENPQNTTPDVCHELINRYEPLGLKFLYYYGDPSGNARKTNSKEARTDYKALEQVMYRFIGDDSNRVPKRSEPVSNSKYFLNRVYSGNTQIEVYIDPKCVNFIGDAKYLKEDSNGSFIKKKVKNKTTGVTSEERGHCMDAHKDFMRTLFEEEYEITKGYI